MANWVIEVQLPQPYTANYSKDGSVEIQVPQSKVEQIDVLLAGPQGPRGDTGLKGDKGDPGAGVVELARAAIDASNSMVIDSFPATFARSAKWMLTLTSSATGNYQTFEMMGLNTGSEVDFVTYGFIGGSVQYVANASLVGQNIVLTITNNESGSLTVDAVRLATTAA